MIVDTKPARLLVVEDEIITARDLQDSLEELGYEVPDVASSGSEALEMAETLQPDLVLMDINLGAGRRDGVDVAHELRERFGVPVIYLSAYADEATLARASATAPLGYLTKPFERREVHATIQMALVKRQLDEQLRESESWYSTSLASIGDGVIATDPSGQVKFVNPVAAGLTGWTHAEALGRPLDEVFALFDRDTGQARPGLASRVLADDKTIFLEEGTLLRSRGGAFVPVDDSAAPIRSQRDGSLLGVVIVFRDQTEKQQIALELERARRLESLGTFAGGLAHDLNNILAVIAGNISLATLPGAPVEVHTRAFAKIDTAVRRAKALTSQFLTFSKGGEPVRRPMDLRVLAAEEVDLIFQGGVSPTARHRLEAAPDLWSVMADEEQIRRVATNFLHNAIQSLPSEGGQVVVRLVNCAREELPATCLGQHYVRLEVRDNGCGISPENLTHVCDPYFTTRATGSGLGLSVCHSIASKHAGFLKIQSELDQGTVAAIYLPANPPAAVPPAVAAASLPDTEPAASGSGTVGATDATKGKLRVLVMDDEPLMRELLARMLDCLGYDGTTAATGEEALRLYQDAAAADRPFDLVSIDLVNKLGMGGEELIGRLRAINPRVVALVCSGYCDHAIMSDYPAYGFSGCLRKPVSLEDFRSGLQRLAPLAAERVNPF